MQAGKSATIFLCEKLIDAITHDEKAVDGILEEIANYPRKLVAYFTEQERQHPEFAINITWTPNSKMTINGFDARGGSFPHETPLYCAARLGKVEVVLKILKQGANDRVTLECALRHAIKHGQVEVVRILRQKQAKVCDIYRDSARENELVADIMALESEEKILALLKAILEPFSAEEHKAVGTEIAASKANWLDKALELAVRQHKSCVVEYLIMQGANPNGLVEIPGRIGFRPDQVPLLAVAMIPTIYPKETSQEQHLKTVQAIFNGAKTNGIKIDLFCIFDVTPHTQLSFAALAVHNKQSLILQELISHEVWLSYAEKTWDGSDWKNRTLLQIAFDNNDMDCFSVLCKSGRVNVHEWDVKKNSLLYYAVEKKNKLAIKALLEAKAVINTKVLELAYNNRDLDVLRALRLCGAEFGDLKLKLDQTEGEFLCWDLLNVFCDPAKDVTALLSASKGVTIFQPTDKEVKLEDQHATPEVLPLLPSTASPTKVSKLTRELMLYFLEQAIEYQWPKVVRYLLARARAENLDLKKQQLEQSSFEQALRKCCTAEQVSFDIALEVLHAFLVDGKYPEANSVFNQQSPLFYAIRNVSNAKLRLQLIEDLLKHGASAIEEKSADNIPLHAAVELDDPTLVATLLKRFPPVTGDNVPVNKRDPQGRTALYHAIMSGKPNKRLIIMQLITAKADVNLARPGRESYSPLWYVLHSTHADLEVALALINAGAKLDYHPNYAQELFEELLNDIVWNKIELDGEKILFFYQLAIKFCAQGINLNKQLNQIPKALYSPIKTLAGYLMLVFVENVYSMKARAFIRRESITKFLQQFLQLTGNHLRPDAQKELLQVFLPLFQLHDIEMSDAAETKEGKKYSGSLCTILGFITNNDVLREIKKNPPRKLAELEIIVIDERIHLLEQRLAKEKEVVTDLMSSIKFLVAERAKKVVPAEDLTPTTFNSTRLFRSLSARKVEPVGTELQSRGSVAKTTEQKEQLLQTASAAPCSAAESKFLAETKEANAETLVAAIKSLALTEVNTFSSKTLAELFNKAMLADFQRKNDEKRINYRFNECAPLTFSLWQHLRSIAAFDVLFTPCDGKSNSLIYGLMRDTSDAALAIVNFFMPLAPRTFLQHANVTESELLVLRDGIRVKLRSVMTESAPSTLIDYYYFLKDLRKKGISGSLLKSSAEKMAEREIYFAEIVKKCLQLAETKEEHADEAPVFPLAMFIDELAQKAQGRKATGKFAGLLKSLILEREQSYKELNEEKVQPARFFTYQQAIVEQLSQDAILLARLLKFRDPLEFSRLLALKVVTPTVATSSMLEQKSSLPESCLVSHDGPTSASAHMQQSAKVEPLLAESPPEMPDSGLMEKRPPSDAVTLII